MLNPLSVLLPHRTIPQYKHPLLLLLTALLTGCGLAPSTPKTIQNAVEVFDPALSAVIDTQADIEVLAEGFVWAEGPLWLEQPGELLFTDVPQNTIYRWHQRSGSHIYLTPSGLDSLHPTGGIEGANGLALDSNGTLLLCQHGNRALARMDAPLLSPTDSFHFLATHYRGRRLNSPNDLHIARNGDIFFTDPPYGLAGKDDDSYKEVPFNGVYRLSTDGQLYLIDSTLSRPNGIALSPDETILYVSNSDPEKAIWVAYSLNDSFAVTQKRIFADKTADVASKKGLPDGLKVTKKGMILATGPGGVLVFHPDGRHLGTIQTGEATANCALDSRETWLYMTAHSYLQRIKLK